MMKKMSFGKVDGYHIGRKTCEVVLEFGYREFKDQEPYFSVCAEMWNNLHTDIIRGGQCVYELAEEFESLRNNKDYALIAVMWKRHHLKPISLIPDEDRAIIDRLMNKEVA